MNAAAILARVKRRCPGYDDSEYLDEINAVYREVWDKIIQLEDSFFTSVATVTTTQQASEFDFLFNQNGNLSAAVSPRFFEITRIRIQQPADFNLIPATPRGFNDPLVLAMSQNTQNQAQSQPPYPYTIFSKASVLFAVPLAAATTIEVTYSMVFTNLVILKNGSISSSTNTVTGVGTNFTDLLPPDVQGSLPGGGQDIAVGAELVLSGDNYLVSTITSDTALTTFTPIAPALVAGTTYQLASVPDTPHGHHGLIADMATANIFSTPGNDPRAVFWQAKAIAGMDSMRDSVMTRQRQEPARRGKFPFSISRNQNYPTVNR